MQLHTPLAIFIVVQQAVCAPPNPARPAQPPPLTADRSLSWLAQGPGPRPRPALLAPTHPEHQPLPSHLAGGLGAPQGAQVHHEPGQDEAQGRLPLHAPVVLDGR